MRAVGTQCHVALARQMSLDCVTAALAKFVCRSTATGSHLATPGHNTQASMEDDADAARRLSVIMRRGEDWR